MYIILTYAYLIVVLFPDNELQNLSVDLEKLGESDFEDLEVKVEKICCEFCEEKFFIPANLDLHVQSEHQSSSENNEKQTIKCLFCYKLFKNKGTYRAHLKLLHKDEAIRCKYRQCFAVFRTEKSLEEHLKKEHFSNKQKNSFKCKVCKIWISSKNYLKSHIERMHTSKFKSIKCEFCTETFESKAKLCHHTKKNHQTEAIKCQSSNCYLYFKSKQEMEDHFNNAHQINCKFCHSILTSNCRYLIHLKQFHLEKKCKFSRCAFYTESKVELEKHVREKHCPKLRKHLLCVYCGKHFSASCGGNILKHIRKFHSKIAIQCDKRGCAIFFKSKEDLEKQKRGAQKG